jgi:hypothetical protein
MLYLSAVGIVTTMFEQRASYEHSICYLAIPILKLCVESICAMLEEDEVRGRHRSQGSKLGHRSVLVDNASFR